MRLMTYNVRCLKDDAEALRRVIRKADPDVLCVQEIYRHPFSDHRVAAFAESIGMLWGGGKRGRMSTVLFTNPRVDVHESGHGLYSVPRPQEPRGYAWARCSIAGSEQFVAVSTHNSLYGALRAGHAHELMADPHVNVGLPTFVAGDFNELESGSFSVVLRENGFKDVGLHEHTSTAAHPTKRIDFIYERGTLPAHPVTLDQFGDDLRVATDHLPVIVDVDLATKA